MKFQSSSPPQIWSNSKWMLVVYCLSCSWIEMGTGVMPPAGMLAMMSGMNMMGPRPGMMPPAGMPQGMPQGMPAPMPGMMPPRPGMMPPPAGMPQGMPQGMMPPRPGMLPPKPGMMPPMGMPQGMPQGMPLCIPLGLGVMMSRMGMMLT